MHIGLISQGRTVKCGEAVGKFLRMMGRDALVELSDGRRVYWSETTDVELLEDCEEVEVNWLPKLEAELARLEGFTVGKYAPLGVTVATPCTELPKNLHEVFIAAALGEKPNDAVLCRRCTSRLCVRADHLFWGTLSDCQRDMVLRGVARPGGKRATVEEVAARAERLRKRISRLKLILETNRPKSIPGNDL